MTGARGILAVARMELQQALVSRLSLLLGGFFLAIVLIAAQVGSRAVESDLGRAVLPPALAGAALLAAIAVSIAFLAPLVAIVGSVLSMVEERATRTIDLLLSRPVSRRGLLVGKMLGRSAFLGLLALLGIPLGLLVVSLTGPVRPSPVDALVLTALTALLCATWVAVALLLSAVVRRPTTALVGAFGVWILSLLWGLVAGTALDAVGLGGLAPLLNPNTLFLGSVQFLMGLPAPLTPFLNLLTTGLNPANAPLALVAFLLAAGALAVGAFDRQDEAGG